MFTLLFFVFLLFIIKIQLFTDLGKVLNKKQLKEVKGAWDYGPCGWGFCLNRFGRCSISACYHDL